MFDDPVSSPDTETKRLPLADNHHKILLTGATGYIGGRLRRRLETESCELRCLARRPEALEPQVAPGTEVVRGDLLTRIFHRQMAWDL